MPRLRHRKSGVVISVPDERVRLFPAYEVVEEPKPEPEQGKPAARKRAPKPEPESDDK